MRSDALCAQGKQPTAMDFDIAARKRSLCRGILDYPSHMSSIAIGGYRSLGRQRRSADA